MTTYKVKRTFGIDDITARTGETVELNAEQAKAVAEFVTKTKGGKGGDDGDGGNAPTVTVASLKAELKELGVALNGATKLADLQALLDEAKASGNAPA